MSNGPFDPQASGGGDGPSHDLEYIFAEYVERLNAGDEIDPQEVIQKHPELAADLLRELHAFESLRFAGAASTAQDPLGTLGDYTLRRQLGRGGMGVVYDAWQNSMNRQVALKVLPAGIAADRRACARFMREAQTAGQLNHENVVRVYSTGVEEGTPWYSMEFVEGETLAQLLARIKDAEPETETPFGPKDQDDYFIRLGRAFSDVADGLQHAHSKGVTHRDIKPSNLILDSDGRLRILDFGLARLEGQESLTLSGDFVGTPLYMSPEQARRKKIPIDHRTDVYSLGTTMYETICGRPPFRGKDHADTLSQIIERDPVEPRKMNLHVPKDLETIVLKCLRKNSRDRFGTAEALAQDLRRFVRGDAVEARPEARWDRFRRHAQRNRRPWIAGVLILLVAVTFSALEVARRKREREREELLRSSQVVAYRSAVRRAAAKILSSGLSLKSTAIKALLLPSYNPQLWTPDDFQGLGPTGSSAPIDEAITVLQEASRTLPDEPDAYLQLARGYRVLGKEEHALAAVERALDRKPGFLPARFLSIQLANGDKDNQKLAFDRLAAEYVEHAGWRAAYVDASRKFEAIRTFDTSRWREAARSFEDLLRALEPVQDEPFVGFFLEVHLRKGIAHLEAREFEDAKRAFIAAAAGSRGLIEPRLLLAKAYYLNGEVERAERELRTLWETAELPDQNSVANWATLIYHSLDDYDRARDWAGRIDNPSLSPRLRMYFSYRLGDLQDAIDVGRSLEESGTRDPIALYVYAVALFKRSESLSLADRLTSLDDVIQVLERASSVDEEFRPARGLLETTRTERSRLMARPKLISFLTRRLPEGASSAALERQGFFSTGQPVAAVNTLIFEQGPVISPNGSEFFYSSFDQGSGRGAEIYMADRDDEGILEAPRAVTEVNTIAQDVVLALSRDGLTLYFASDRPGSQDWDIWWATRPSLQEAFGEPEIVTELSTPSMDGFVGLSITGDDRELYFARHRVGDIFVAWRSSNDEPWGNVTQVTELDNRPGAGEGGPMISSDGLTIFFMAWDRSGGFGDHDLWMATRPDRFDEQGSRVPFGEPINLGPAINSAKIEWQPALSPDWPAAGSQIYYSTGLRDQDYDIYVARWHPDCNGNMIDDLEEISRGDARDGNANGIPDECETRSIEIKRED